MSRVPSCNVVPHAGRIQDFDENFYRQFQIVISGLDNIEARRWINSVLVGMVSERVFSSNNEIQYLCSSPTSSNVLL